MSVATILNLPIELDLYIRSFLPFTTLCSSSRVSKSWKILNQQDPLWKIHIKNHFPNLILSNNKSFKEAFHISKIEFMNKTPMRRWIEFFGGIYKFVNFPHFFFEGGFDENLPSKIKLECLKDPISIGEAKSTRGFPESEIIYFFVLKAEKILNQEQFLIIISPRDIRWQVDILGNYYFVDFEAKDEAKDFDEFLLHKLKTIVSGTNPQMRLVKN